VLLGTVYLSSSRKVGYSMSKKDAANKPLGLTAKLAEERQEILTTQESCAGRLEYLKSRYDDLESQRQSLLDNAPRITCGGVVPREILEELTRVNTEIKRLTDQNTDHMRRLAEIDRLIGAGERVKNLTAELSDNRNKFNTARQELDRVDTTIISLTEDSNCLETERKSIMDSYAAENVAALSEGKSKLELPPRLLALAGEIEATRASLEAARNLKIDGDALLESLETTAGHLRRALAEARYALAELEYIQAIQGIMPTILEFSALGRVLGYHRADDIRLTVDREALEAATTALYAELR
jgi:chromosome segregation ATPase